MSNVTFGGDSKLTLGGIPLDVDELDFLKSLGIVIPADFTRIVDIEDTNIEGKVSVNVSTTLTVPVEEFSRKLADLLLDSATAPTQPITEEQAEPPASEQDNELPRGSGVRSYYRRVYATCRRHPGQWYLLSSYKGHKNAHTMATHIRQGGSSLGRDFESKVQGRDVLVRYVGVES